MVTFLENLKKKTADLFTPKAPVIRSNVKTSFKDLADQRAIVLQNKTTPFVRNASAQLGGIVRTGASAADRLLAGQARDVSDFTTGRLRVTPSDVLTGVKKTAAVGIKAPGFLAQGFNAGILNIGTTVAKAAIPGYNPTSSALVRSITGNESGKVTPYQELFPAVRGWALSQGATPKGASVVAGFSILGAYAIDTPGISSGTKPLFNASKRTIAELAKADTDDAIKAVIRSDNPALNDEAVDFLTPMFKLAKTEDDVTKTISLTNNSARMIAQQANNRQVIDTAKANEVKIATAAEDISGPLRPLAEEARKYKSAEDLNLPVEKKGHILDSLKGSVDTARLDSKLLDDVISLDKRNFQIQTTGKLRSDYWLKKIKNGERPPILVGLEKGQLKVIDGNHRATAYIEEGVQDVPIIFTREAKTKAEGLYTQATKGDSAGTPSKATAAKTVSRTEPINPTLIKNLGTVKDPYEALNILKNEYPNLPDKVVDRLVDRFVKTKRLPDVENLIRSARDLDQKMRPGGTVRTAGTKLPKGDAKILRETVPQAVRRVMSQDKKIAYIKTLKEKFDNPNEAVIAEAEHSRIWDDINQGIIDEYENLGNQRSFLSDAMASMEGSTLFNKYYKNFKRSADDPTEALQDLHNRAAKKKREVTNYRRGLGKKKPALTKREEQLVRLDTEIEEYGFKNFDEAQEAVEKYAELRTEVARITAEIKALKPRVRDARILQGELDKIAVIPQKEVLEIDKVITQANFRDYFNDITGIAWQTKDVVRNFEAFFGKLYPKVKKAILEPFDIAKGARVNEVRKLGDELSDGVVNKFGFKRGSKESAAIQRYGDTDLPAGERRSYKQLTEEFGKEKADNIVAADKWFRSQYDRLIEELNEVRSKIYPNNPGKLIAKRKNYYAHYREMSSTWGDALREFFDTPSGIDPKLAGISEFTKAKSKFLPFAEQRLTQATEIDAIGGFLNYAELFSYAKHIDPQVSKFRYLHRKIAEVAPKTGETVQMPNGKSIKSKGAENFLGFVDNFARDLTGNTHIIDRFVQMIVGRKTMRIGRFFNNHLKANSVLGNFGSMLAQVASVPAGIADTRLYAAKGLQRTIASTVVHNEPMSKSTFLNERYQKYLSERFPFQFTDKPVRVTYDTTRKHAAWAMQKIDELGTKFIWNSEYEKALSKKIDDPIKYADDRTRRIVAGRGIGEVPLIQKAVSTQFIIPFTLEVGNAWWLMKDWVTKKEFAALTTLFLGNYIFNEIAENTRGSRVVFDPINSLIEGARSLAAEYDEGNYGRGTIKFAGRQLGELLTAVPTGQLLAAAVPDKRVQSLTEWSTGAPITKREIFGNSTAGRFGEPLLLSSLDPKEALYRILPPVGGVQIRKTVAGIKALIKGQAEDSKGRATFDIEKTPQNIARALLFGSGATSEAREYFDSRNALFERLNRQDSEEFMTRAQAQDDLQDIAALSKKGDSEGAKARLREIAAEDPNRAQAVIDAIQDKQKGLSGNDSIIKQLNVKNGERAKYIADQMQDMSSQEKKEYLKELASKKLISTDVIAQVAVLLKK